MIEKPIKKLADVDYSKLFKSNELNQRGKDEVSLFAAKINEIIDVVNDMRGDISD